MKILKDINLPLTLHEFEIDPYLVQDVLFNLVKNSLKYTNEGQIEVRCEFKNGALEFMVRDTGIGIFKNIQQKIFERFVRGNSELTNPVDGAGLGLSIAKAYVERHGGKIWLESEPGAGSTFYFTVPIQPNIK